VKEEQLVDILVLVMVFLQRDIVHGIRKRIPISTLLKGKRNN